MDGNGHVSNLVSILSFFCDDLPMSVSQFFILSDWANLFHYALQGLVTNELQENDYFVDIPTLLPDLNPNTTSIVGFLGESESFISKEKIAGFLRWL